MVNFSRFCEILVEVSLNTPAQLSLPLYLPDDETFASFWPGDNSSLLAALQNVKDQYRGLLEMGFYDVDTYLPEFRQALKDDGVETVIAELQKQYDEWLKTK